MHPTTQTKGVPMMLVIALLVTMTTSKADGGSQWQYKIKPGSDIHGGVKMGVVDDNCDNGKDNLEVDWNGDPEDYTCLRWPYPSNRQKQVVEEEAECQTKLNPPLHKCMSTPIQYKDPIPTSGAHRPLWAKFGEYRYLPKQRWLHNLEHGCAVFLYHPCADPNEIEKLKEIARSCLRKHIITPLKELSRETPFAVLTYGCKLLLPYVDEQRVVEFLRDHALHAPEREVVADGQFGAELVRPAGIVSDEKDSVVCPSSRQVNVETLLDDLL